MLNLNLNILGASNKPIVPIQPAPAPTTTTTSTTTTSTTTTSTTTSTTTTGAPVSLRTDIYSASLVYAAPGSQFATLGMTSFREDISQLIRGTGTGYGVLPSTGSGAVSSYTGSLFSGYNTAIQLSGSVNNGAIAGTDTNIQFPTQNFTIETWINQATASIKGVGQGFNNVSWYYQYNNGVGFATTDVSGDVPGTRFLVITAAGAEVYLDSNSYGRNASVWYHNAVQRSGSAFNSLFNGECVQTFTLAATLKTGTQAFELFNRQDDGVNTARFQDYRIYNGVAKYGSLVSGSLYSVPESMVIA
jgi:hypothetical protein